MVVGYAGGKSEWPTYEKIGDHTEAIRVEFDLNIISYRGILEEFFKQQGGPPTDPDFDRQYRYLLEFIYIKIFILYTFLILDFQGRRF